MTEVNSSIRDLVESLHREEDLLAKQVLGAQLVGVCVGLFSDVLGYEAARGRITELVDGLEFLFQKGKVH